MNGFGRRHSVSPNEATTLSPIFTSKLSGLEPPKMLLSQATITSFDDSKSSSAGFYIGSFGHDSLLSLKAGKSTAISALSSMNNEEFSSRSSSDTIKDTAFTGDFESQGDVQRKNSSNRIMLAKKIQPLKPSLSENRLHDQRRQQTPIHQPSRRKAWVLNPFHEQDEEQVLAEYSHSRRRWSHVFPLGEIEFKKKAGKGQVLFRMSKTWMKCF